MMLLMLLLLLLLLLSLFLLLLLLYAMNELLLKIYINRNSSAFNLKYLAIVNCHRYWLGMLMTFAIPSLTCGYSLRAKSNGDFWIEYDE